MSFAANNAQTMQQPMYGQPMMTQPMMQPMMGMGMTGPYMQYNQPQQLAEPTQGLSPQRLAELKKNGGGNFKVQITQEQMDQAYCTHRDGHKLMTYPTNNPNKPGEVCCKLCGAKFVPVENVSLEDINNSCYDFHDLLHTMKLLNIDISPKLCQDIMQILPIVDIIPEFYKISLDRFNRYADPYNIANQQQPYNVNGFALLNSLVGGQPMMPQMMQPVVPQPGMQMQQPMYGQPMMTMPQQGMPMNPMQMQMTANAPGMQSNGFGVTQAPINVEPTVQPQQQPAQEQPKVTKQLQA